MTEDDQRPDLENRARFQSRAGFSPVDAVHPTRSDDLVLRWLEAAVKRGEPPRAALDVGSACGNGTSLLLNARLGHNQGVRLEAVNVSEADLESDRAFARQVPGYANCHFQRADIALGLPFEDQTFDAVCLGDVLERLDRPIDALRELRRVTKAGGSIVVSTPLRASLFKTGSGMTLAELRTAAEAAGLRVAVLKLMSVMSGSRWFEEHPRLLSGTLFLGTLRHPSRAHRAVVLLTPT